MSAATATASRRVGPASCTVAYGPNPAGRCEWDGQTIRVGGFRWCSTACRDAFEAAHNWPAARAAALRRAARRCQVCGARARLEVHHDPPVDKDTGYEPGCQHHPDRLTVLCSTHHALRHRWLRAKPGTQLALFRAA